MGRPTKAEAEERAATPWKLDFRDPDDGDEEALPDWNNMSDEELARMKKEVKAADPRRKPAPGVRVGKHRKGGGGSKAKRRKKKKGRR